MNIKNEKCALMRPACPTSKGSLTIGYWITTTLAGAASVVGAPISNHDNCPEAVTGKEVYNV